MRGLAHHSQTRVKLKSTHSPGHSGRQHSSAHVSYRVLTQASVIRLCSSMFTPVHSLKSRTLHCTLHCKLHTPLTS